MKFIFKMESVLIAITIILSSVLLVKLLLKLRSALPWRVNCWFCNSNFWVKYLDRNSWTCPKCEQYNGFTKDGDYNKPILISNDQTMKTPKVFQNSPPKNGLCKMCNINQQLKVAQLANFVPMSDKNFDNEIEMYRIQLEKAYKLCTPCKKVVLMKLHKEKETLLGSKLVETRTPEKKIEKNENNELLKKFVNNASMFIAVILFILVSFELYTNIMQKYENLHSTITNFKNIIMGLLERLFSIVKMKTYMTFPSLENYIYDLHNVEMLPKSFILRYINLENINIIIQKALGGFVCLLQIIGLVCNVNNMKSMIVIDLQWLIFVISTLGQRYIKLETIYISLIKTLCTLIVIVVYKMTKTQSKRTSRKVPMTPKRMKNPMNAPHPLIDDDDDEDLMNLDTDDDVSLSKFGLHNFSESSTDTASPINTSFINGRTFTPRCDSLWTKPKINTSFCVNPVLTKSPSSVSDTVFIKPSFNKYQKLVKDDSDSELDESIGTLCISSPVKSKKKSNSIFSLRKFTATPNFVAPTPVMRRPLISPSKLGHSTSWVAGGYWGSEGDRQMFSLDGSRSSSQSSGFESQTSSMNQRNVFSQPSNEDSICCEPMLDRFPSMSNLGYQSPQNFSRINSPVFPQMQYNGHVHIPQPKFAKQSAPSSVFSQKQQYVQNNMFKTPGGMGLVKLPQVSSFTSP